MSTTIRGFYRPALRLVTVAVVATLLAWSGTQSPTARSAGSPDAAQVRLVAQHTKAHTKGHTKRGHQHRSHKSGHRHPHRKHGHKHRKHGAKHLSLGQRVVREAAAQAGDPYVWGAAGPKAFDCSGLTSFVYRVAVGKRLPHSSSAQQGATRRVTAKAARPGDLVFFHDGGGVYHVAIYAGHHAVWHAPYPGQRVRKERIWTNAVTYGHVR